MFWYLSLYKTYMHVQPACCFGDDDGDDDDDDNSQVHLRVDMSYKNLA